MGYYQKWRVQDFPEGGTNSQSGCDENCMKMKEFGPQGRRPWRPLRSATDQFTGSGGPKISQGRQPIILKIFPQKTV